MNKTQNRLLALLLSVCLLCTLVGCSEKEAPEETILPVIRIPEPERHQKCTDLGTPLADIRVRQALILAVDMDTVLESLFYGNARRAVSLTEAEDWLNTGLAVWDYDPDKAKELLAEVGWPSDYVLDVVYWEEDVLTVDLLNIIGSYWEAVGIRAEFRKLEGDVAEQLWTAPAEAEGDSEVVWDLACGTVESLTEPERYAIFASDSKRNSHTPAIEGLDDLIHRSMESQAPAEQKKLVCQIQQILAEHMAVIPLLHEQFFVCTGSHIDTADTVWGDDRYAYDKHIPDWTTDREDRTLYVTGGPGDAFAMTAEEPGRYLYQELVFQRLLNGDNHLNPTDGQIAESYLLSDDGKTLEFTVRKGLTWHDGKPLTAEDVKFTFELYMRCPETGIALVRVLDHLTGAQDYKDYETEECSGIKVDGNKVTFSFAQTQPDVLKAFAQWPILPKHKLKNANPERLQRDRFWKNPIGSGPYRVEEVKLGDHCVLTRWEDFPETGAGNIDDIYMVSAADTELAVYAAMDRLDYGFGSSADDRMLLEAMDGMDVTPIPVFKTRCFFINKYPHASYIALQAAEAETTAPTE